MHIARNIRLLSWFNFWTDFRPYAPIAIIYFAQVSGSYALGMSVYSIVMLAQAIFEVPTGILSDRVGRKMTIVYGAVAAVIGMAFYAIGGTYLALVIGGILEGLARSFYSGNNEALLFDTVTEMGERTNYHEYLGKTSSMCQFALAISALLGGFIAAVSFRIVMWVSVIPMVLALFVSFRLIEPQIHSAKSGNVFSHLAEAIRHFMRNPRLRLLSITSILSFAIGEASWLFRSVFIEMLWPVWAIGLAQMIGNITAAISFYFAGPLIRRFGEFKLLVGGKIFGEAVNLIGLLLSSVVSPALMSSGSIFFGVNTVARGNLVQQEFSDEQRATMGSLNSFAGSLVFAAFSLLLGAVADHFGVTIALIGAALLMFIPIMMYAYVLRPRKAKAKVSVEPSLGD
ncbi:MAG: MFS transporter [Anaerolineae bacterium]|nr:MFS transporter [Anaerolineae bacterium]